MLLVVANLPVVEFALLNSVAGMIADHAATAGITTRNVAGEFCVAGHVADEAATAQTGVVAGRKCVARIVADYAAPALLPSTETCHLAYAGVATDDARTVRANECTGQVAVVARLVADNAAIVLTREAARALTVARPVADDAVANDGAGSCGIAGVIADDTVTTKGSCTVAGLICVARVVSNLDAIS